MVLSMQHRRINPSIAAISLLSLLFLASASSAEEVAAPPRPRIALLAPERLRQGDLLLAWVVTIEAPTDLGARAAETAVPAPPRIRLLAPDGSAAAEARCFALPSILEAPRPDEPIARVYGALIPLSTELAPGSYSIAADSGELGQAGASLAVEAREFPLEVIGLDASNSALRARPTKRQQTEARKLYALLGKTDEGAVYADFSPFLFPVEGGFKSAGFGDRRRYLLSSGGSETSSHAGIDWGVVKGTPVHACERGRVAMVADRELTGMTVVIEHLPGLYSLYFHLSSIKVREGEFVERGETIALSGSTGLSTGPHLHWELRAMGEAVDPEYWLGAPLLDKEAIKATIIGLIEGR
jgi:murein DD-endopeptidase MepM/ murein hydrolase activator NlpD